MEEVTIPVLSRLDDMWADYSGRFIRRMAGARQPWFLYHCTRGAHFDNYPLERFLGSSPARHPYKDTLVELDDIVARLVRELEATGQLEHTLIVLSSDNGPHMETWPDAAYTPFRCAKDSTWEGGVRVPALFAWPGMIDADRVSDGLLNFSDLVPTALALAGNEASRSSRRSIRRCARTSGAGGLRSGSSNTHSRWGSVRAWIWTRRSGSGGALEDEEIARRLELRK